MKKVGAGRYLCEADKDAKYEVEIEEDLMFPIISGEEAKRYIEPKSDTYLLFPYRRNEAGASVISAEDLEKSYPKAWRYLSSHKESLCRREATIDRAGNIIEAPFADDEWYRFSRSQSLNRLNIPKLVAAGTVPHLRFAFDEEGRFFLTGGRVDGVVATDLNRAWFLLGILNAQPADFVFRRIGRVKEGGFFEANKQFIAPLPVPKVDPKQQAQVASLAQLLQGAHTRRRDLIINVERRLETMRMRRRPETWLFPTLKTKAQRFEETPTALDQETRTKLANERFVDDLEALYGGITDRLHPGAVFAPQCLDGELSLSIDGSTVIEHIFLEKKEADLVLAQWEVLASTISITEKTNGKKLCDQLRKLAVPDKEVTVKQLIDFSERLAGIEVEIAQLETQTNILVYSLYQLSNAEIALVERDTRR